VTLLVCVDLTMLQKAKEATRKERLLCKHRDKNGLSDQINFDLTYATCFNLAHQYHCNGHLTEALATYGIVVKNKQYPQAGRLRVNMGNIYYQQVT
jgi:intraflagellar transport protein 88